VLTEAQKMAVAENLSPRLPSWLVLCHVPAARAPSRELRQRQPWLLRRFSRPRSLQATESRAQEGMPGQLGRRNPGRSKQMPASDACSCQKELKG
jgi:hypothetical protein